MPSILPVMSDAVYAARGEGVLPLHRLIRPAISQPALSSGAHGLVHPVGESVRGWTRRRGMSKRITTRGSIGAWVVWLIAFIALGVVLRSAGSSGSPPPAAVIPYAVLAIAGIVMLVMWIG